MPWLPDPPRAAGAPLPPCSARPPALRPLTSFHRVGPNPPSAQGSKSEPVSRDHDRLRTRFMENLEAIFQSIAGPGNLGDLSPSSPGDLTAGDHFPLWPAQFDSKRNWSIVHLGIRDRWNMDELGAALNLESRDQGDLISNIPRQLAHLLDRRPSAP
jgi:hypothetical protein